MEPHLHLPIGVFTFWLSEMPAESSDCVLQPSGRGRRMTLLGEAEADSQWITPGWARLEPSGDDWRLPTFTRAIPRSRPAFAAPGLRELSQEEWLRYSGDGFRFPPYTYRDTFCLARLCKDSGKLMRETARVATAVEREVVMGFVPHHTKHSRAREPQAEGFVARGQREVRRDWKQLPYSLYIGPPGKVPRLARTLWRWVDPFFTPGALRRGGRSLGLGSPPRPGGHGAPSLFRAGFFARACTSASWC